LDEYSLTFENGYTFYRHDSINTVVSPPNTGNVTFSPLNYPGVGPIVEYAATDSFVFLRTLGRNGANAVDETSEYFFLIDTASDTVRGPFSRAQFQGDADVASAGPLKWRTPRNSGGLILLAVGGSCLLLPVLAAGALIWILVRSRRQAAH